MKMALAEFNNKKFFMALAEFYAKATRILFNLSDFRLKPSIFC